MNESTSTHWLCLLILTGQIVLTVIIWAILEMRVTRREIREIEGEHEDQGIGWTGLAIAGFCFALAVVWASVEGFCRKLLPSRAIRRKRYQR